MNSVGETGSRTKKVFYGWWVVGAGTLLYFLGIGSIFYGFSTFFNPMVAEFGWSRTVTSGAYSLSRLEGGIEGPIVGPLIDKFGARKMIFAGVILAGVGFIVLSRINNALGLYLIFGLLISMGYNTGFFHATTTATANWFIKRRSRALGLITVGGGLGGAAIVPLLALLITNFGWRWAAIIIGLIMLAVGIPLAFVIRSKPEDVGMRPDGVEAAAAGAAASQTVTDVSAEVAEGEVNYTVREALRTKAFWTYIVAMMLRACILSSIVIHQIPRLTDVGIPYQAAANCLGIMIFISIPARFVFGWLGDMFDKRVLMFITSMIQAVGIFIFIQVSNLWMAYLFVAVYGLGYGGAIPLSVALRGQLFGRKIFATIGGISSGFSAIGTVAAPVLAGYVYDVSGSYAVAFYALLGLIVLSGLTFLMIRWPKPPARLAGVPGGN